MDTIKTTSELSKFCTFACKFDYITVDTEFLRERTYYPKLCLIQLAIPSDHKNSAVLIDPLAGNLDLSPLYELFLNCLLYTSPSPRDRTRSRMPSSA